MITAVEIENFKGIRERTRIEIKPITLLFGPNSAGKSTLLHALQLAREILTRRNLDVDVTDGGAGFIDLGGFRNYVHGRDASKAVTLRFDLDLGDTNFPLEYPMAEYLIPIPGRDADETLDVSTIGDEIQTGWVEIEIRWNADAERGYVAHYTVGLDGVPFARILCGTPEVSHLNIYHPLVRWKTIADDSVGLLDHLNPDARPIAAAKFFTGRPIDWNEAAFPSEQFIDGRAPSSDEMRDWVLRGSASSANTDDSDEAQPVSVIYAARPDGGAIRVWGVHGHEGFWSSSEITEYLTRLLEQPGPEELDSTDRFDRGDPADEFNWAYIGNSELDLPGQGPDALPDLDRDLLLFGCLTDGDTYGGNTDSMPREPRAARRLDEERREAFRQTVGRERKAVFQRLMNRLLLVPGRALRDALDELRYVGPVRESVPRTFSTPRFPDPRRWAGGLAAWDALARDPDGLAVQIDAWLGGETQLNTGYGLRIEQFRELPTDHELTALVESGRIGDDADADQLRKLLADLPIKRRVVLTSLVTGRTMSPADVGQGLTQVIPVVVASLQPFGDGAKPRGGLVAIEQPELHLHPAAQVGLGSLFIAAVTMLPGHRMLIETHSEHLLLRLLRRIRQTSNGQLPPDQPGFHPDRLAIICFEPPTGGEATRMYRLRVDDQGEFLDPWPRGFFDERAEELFGP